MIVMTGLVLIAVSHLCVKSVVFEVDGFSNYYMNPDKVLPLLIGHVTLSYYTRVEMTGYFLH